MKINVHLPREETASYILPAADGQGINPFSIALSYCAEMPRPNVEEVVVACVQVHCPLLKGRGLRDERVFSTKPSGSRIMAFVAFPVQEEIKHHLSPQAFRGFYSRILSIILKALI